MTDLAKWLLACVAEDEAVAKAAFRDAGHNVCVRGVWEFVVEKKVDDGQWIGGS